MDGQPAGAQPTGPQPKGVQPTGVLRTDAPPDAPARKVASFTAPLQVAEEHHLCPGCGHPVAWRLLLEVISELSLAQRAIGIVGHGCYTNIVRLADIDFLQCLHGRAPAVATGVKRVRPEAAVFTLQGDGDMASEGLAEILHTAARGERVTAIMLNNGVFGDTGGQMTAASVVGQRTKTSIDGRDPGLHGYPVPVADLVASLAGTAFVARGAVNTAGAVAHTKRHLRRAFELQVEGAGFTMVEILTMCPTGWFVPTNEGPGYLSDSFEETYPLGTLKQP
ncbi:MAG TPA: thiamine pyrophosphate-dependent enzyme [Acidimicrobiales bacterium]|nr:thiamine pyrophosphate-dependent enzyme [Acidimicrobiales bacterium]